MTYIFVFLLWCLFGVVSSTQDDLDEVKESNMTLKETVLTLSGQMVVVIDNMEKMNKKIQSLEERLSKQEMVAKAASVPEKVVTDVTHQKYQFSSLGCLGDILTLSCQSPKTIFVESADYGQYTHPCTSGCCPPHPRYDCVELVEENRPQDWLALKALCDNQTSCQFEYLGSNIDTCEADFIADYMAIYYTCLPEDDTEPVAFMVLHDENRAYEEYEMVVFDTVETNVGGHFQVPSSTFICPDNGIYLFILHIYNVPGQQIDCRITKESTRIANVWADNDAEAYNQASNSAVIECMKGERVFVDVGGGEGTLYGNIHRTSFSGVLLHRYD